MAKQKKNEKLKKKMLCKLRSFKVKKLVSKLMCKQKKNISVEKVDSLPKDFFFELLS